jgi:hypothetical protein
MKIMTQDQHCERSTFLNTVFESLLVVQYVIVQGRSFVYKDHILVMSFFNAYLNSCSKWKDEWNNTLTLL